MISIIIPVFNEEDTIISLLDHLRGNAVQRLEILVVDGGSTDYTWSILVDYKKHYPEFISHVLTSDKGRGKQLHVGAHHATGDILYFLHADSYPPAQFDDLIYKAVLNGYPAGCFRMKFNSTHPWLKIIGWFTRFSWQASRGGDQSQYITKELYKRMGGYRTNLPIYEDYDLIQRLYDNKTFHVIPEWLSTSDRRYREVGVMKLQWFYLKIYWKKYRGASIEEIYQYYLSKCN
jgi:rSAM/selenodomain-associated transferase 2